MKKRRLNKKKVIPFFVAFIILWILVGTYLLHHQNIEDELQKKGYSLSEISEIKGVLQEKDLKILLDYNYSATVSHIMKEEGFEEENLKSYLDFLFQYKTAEAYDIVFLVNHKKEKILYTAEIHAILNSEDFKQENLDRYLSYYEKKQLKGEYIVFAVNQNLDKEDSNMDDTIFLFLGKEYSLNRNLERYQKYYEKHKDLSIDEVITRVNSNLDMTFYQDINPTDLSKDNLVIVNKYYYLEKDYVPTNLVAISSIYGIGQIKDEVYNAFIKMYNDAVLEGLYLYISSPYRSYNRQNELYTNYVARDGKKNADTYSARPGFSEHQTGLAMDLGTSSNHNIGDFEKSKEFTWVKNNAHRYGFILRYPENKEYITGYMYEPWHYRYVGVDVANYIYEHNITYEEYYEYFIK